MTMTTFRLRRWARTVAVASGLAIVLTGCGSIYDVPLPGGANVGSKPLKVHILFRDVMDLVPQSTVKVNDVSVGRVTAIDLKGQVADVTVEIPRATDLPANALATIRQTSLLGEKFVSLSAPSDPQGKLVNGATIGLTSSGTNPEVEQVLKSLGALLSGGGVGQLKVISEELNKAIGGKEAQVRDVLSKLHFFMGQLSDSKSQIVTAIDNLNRLAVNLQKQTPTIAATLDDLPAALASVNTQRADLVKMLSALNKLSGVGVQVIQASKQATINGLTDLSPVLSQLAKAGDNFVKSFQIGLTYPFVDAVVGTTPAAARNFEFGDYTNLSVHLDLDLLNLTVPGLPVQPLQGLIQLCKTSPAGPLCDALLPAVDALCATPLGTLPICASNGANATALPAAPKVAKAPSQPQGVSGISGGLGALAGGTSPTPSSSPTPSNSGLGGFLKGLLGRTAYGSSGAVMREPGDGMSYLLLQGAMQ